jgi:thymidine phosphorylase
VGNANEVRGVDETLKGRGPKDVEALSVSLAARMLVLAGIEDVGRRRGTPRASGDGQRAGVEKFRAIIEAQGGDPRVMDEPDRLPQPVCARRLRRRLTVWSSAMDAELVGRAAVALGAGRDPRGCAASMPRPASTC